MDELIKEKEQKENKSKKPKKQKLLNDEEEEINKLQNKEIKKNYFQRLFPRNRNEKPGGEYYPMYTGAMILILAYLLLFFVNY